MICCPAVETFRCISKANTLPDNFKPHTVKQMLHSCPGQLRFIYFSRDFLVGCDIVVVLNF